MALARPFFGLILLAILVLTVFGAVLMLRMPSGIYPEVAFPRISVIVQTPGLAVKNVEMAVTRPIEDAMSVVLGVRLVRSKTIRGAWILTSISRPAPRWFRPSTTCGRRSPKSAAQFPAGTRLLVERQTPSIFPIISFVVTGGRDPAALRDYAYYDLRPRISRIDDVSYVTV